MRVFTQPCVATSCGVPLRSTPPSPTYGPSVFSRITTKSCGSVPGRADERALVDVEVELEAHLQQQAALDDARRHLRRADGAEQDGVEAAQLVERRVGEDLAVAQVARAAEVEVGRCRGRRRPPATTFSASAVTSGPIPSPPITAIRCCCMRPWPAQATRAE